MSKRRASASLLIAALLTIPSLYARAGTPPGGWTKAVKVRSAADDRGHDGVVVDGRMHAVFAGELADIPGTVSLHYGTNDGPNAAWSWKAIKDISSIEDLTPAIAVDAQGTVHIVYHYRTPQGEDVVEVASNTGGTWTFEVLAGPGGVPIGAARTPDIAIQADGTPAVVFTGDQAPPCTGDADLYFSELLAVGWTAPQNVSADDIDCREHTFPALAGGPDGLHLAYRAVDVALGEEGLHYRSGTLSNATEETVDAVTQVQERGVDITTDPTGAPHVVYVAQSGGDLVVRYARRDGATWSSADVRNDPQLGGKPSIAIGANGPAVAFTEGPRAFLAEDTTEGWTTKNLNAESQTNRDPVLSSVPGERLHALLVRDADQDSLLYLHEAPRAQAEFAVAGTEFRGGEPVDMSGDLDPATVRERVKIETQKFKDGSWRAYDMVKLRTRADGSFDYTHDAFPAGRKYRSRLIWKDTIDHLDGKTVWENFNVERKRAH